MLDLDQHLHSASFKLRSEAARQLSHNLLRIKDIFCGSEIVSPPLKANQSLKTMLDGLPYLPIEWFREKKVSEHVAAEKLFRSSGTTGAVRSLAAFSHDGLILYQISALKTFFSVLSRLHPARPRPMSGYSLIPFGEARGQTKGWEESSLSQMIEWISDVVPVVYISPELAAKGKWLKSTDPVWVFGTAYHFVKLMDASARCPLPTGSIIFETGGTKNESRVVDRAELYSGIARIFSVRESSIVSEYGMCELASQAYDFVPSNGRLMCPTVLPFSTVG